MSLAAIADRVHQRMEGDNTERATFTQLANDLETAAINNPAWAGKLRSMAQAFRRISQQEEEHIKAETKIYQDLGRIQSQRTTAMAEAAQLAKGAATAGRAAGRLAGKGLAYIGEKLSALETEGGVRRLPTVSAAVVARGLSMPGGPKRFVAPGEYFVDERLSELRHVANPHMTIHLNEFELEYFRDKAR